MSEEKLKQYQHAMEIDQATGKPMPKMSIAGASDGGGALGVNVKQSEIVQPTDLQSRYSQIIQTHNAVSVEAGAASTSVFLDCDRFDKIAFSYKNDANTSNGAVIEWSHDGVNNFQSETIKGLGNSWGVTYETGTKARYFKLILTNNDTVAHTMSAYAYLKV